MPSGGLEDFAPERMRVLRERTRTKLDVVAVACEVTIGTARNWEAGRLTPSEKKACKLAALLKVHPADLTNTPRDQPTLKQLRQWIGLNGDEAAAKAEIGVTPIYTAESYVSRIPAHITTALAGAYEVGETEIEAAWQRGRTQKYGDGV